MTPKQVTEGNDRAGHKVVGEPGSTDGSALEARDSGVLVGSSGQGNAPPIDVCDLISEQIFASTSPEVASHLDNLRQQYNDAMHMHRHYKDLAINGTEADVGPMSADELALRYLSEANSISRHMTNLISETMKQSTRKAIELRKLREKETNSDKKAQQITQNNTVINNFTSAGRREQIRIIEESYESEILDGTEGLPSKESLMKKITNTEDPSPEKEEDAR